MVVEDHLMLHGIQQVWWNLITLAFLLRYINAKLVYASHLLKELHTFGLNYIFEPLPFNIVIVLPC